MLSPGSILTGPFSGFSVITRGTCAVLLTCSTLCRNDSRVARGERPGCSRVDQRSESEAVGEVESKAGTAGVTYELPVGSREEGMKQ